MAVSEDCCVGIINRTMLGLMKPNAFIVPLNPYHVDYSALYTALADKTIGGAFLDVWPSGCWGLNVTCGPPYGASTFPFSADAVGGTSANSTTSR